MGGRESGGMVASNGGGEDVFSMCMYMYNVLCMCAIMCDILTSCNYMYMYSMCDVMQVGVSSVCVVMYMYVWLLILVLINLATCIL